MWITRATDDESKASRSQKQPYHDRDHRKLKKILRFLIKNAKIWGQTSKQITYM